MEKIIVEKNNNSVPKKEMKSYWNDFVKHFFSIYQSKYWIWKLIIFLTVSLIVFTSSFVVREVIINLPEKEYNFMKGFLQINIMGNTGVSFSMFNSSDVGLVYFIQCLPIIIAFGFLIFTKNIYIDIGLTLVLTGGMCNVIDRSLYDNYASGVAEIERTNAVVDYLYFPFIGENGSAVFNVPDMMIILGVIIIVITLIVQFIIEWINESKNEENKNKQSTTSATTSPTNNNSTVKANQIKNQNINKIQSAIKKQQEKRK